MFRKKKIELTSPLSVRVYAEVDQQETTKRYYQNVLVRSKARPKEFPLWDAWTKLLLSTTVIPLFLKDFWIMGSYLGPNCRLEPEACTVQNARSVLSPDYIVEDGVRSTREQRQDLPQSDRVSLFINGLYKGDLQISSANVATVDLHAFPELNALHKPLKLTFKYYDAFAHSLLSPDEVERILEQGAPAMIPASPGNGRRKTRFFMLLLKTVIK